MFKKVISSPIRWAGSKKKLLNEMLEKMFVRDKENYIECFLGSGVVLLNVLLNKEILGYKNFYVNDINSNIISFYLILKTDVDFLIGELEKLEKQYNDKSIEGKKIFYYDIRNKFNNLKKNDKMKPIYFYFLMRMGFNGVYRENRNGEFNVPFGKKDKFCFQRDGLKEISKLIQNVEFYNLDYKQFLYIIKSKCDLNKSFIYCDPPYVPEDMLVNQKQELYTNFTFDHEDFFNVINDINCGTTMISMADSVLATKIYNKYGFKKKNINQIIRIINPKKLFASKEIAYINYTIEDE